MLGILSPSFRQRLGCTNPTRNRRRFNGRTSGNLEYDSETMNLIKHPFKYAGKVKTGELLSPHVNQLIEEINQACYDLSRRLKKQGYRTLVLPSRGLPFRPGQMKAVLSYTHVAEAAGMGTIGTHSYLITPEFGITEAPLQTTKRIDPIDDCTHCLDCVKICPVDAIASPTPGYVATQQGIRKLLVGL